MPLFRVTGPDGATYEVNAPEGATEEQAIEYAQSQMAQPKSQGAPGMVSYKGMNVMPSLQENPQNPFKAALGGARQAYDRLGGGLYQGIYEATPEAVFKAFGSDKKAKLDDLQKEMAFKDAAYAPFKRANPIASSIGEAAPAVVVSLGVPGGGSLVGSVLSGAATSAIPAALSYGSMDERLKRGKEEGVAGGLGGGLGYAGAKAISSAITPFKGAGLTDDAIEAAKRLELNLTAGQKTGNRALQGVENYLERTPGFAGTMQAHREGAQSALNTRAAKAIGESADNVGEKTLNAAATRIGGEFDRLNALAKPDISSPAFESAVRRAQSANNSLGPLRNPEINKLTDDVLDMAYTGFPLTGPSYQTLRSRLGSRAHDAMGSGNSEVGNALKTVQKAFDAAADRSLSSADQAALEMTRKQYAAYKALTKGLAAEGGDVSAARVGSALRKQSPDRFRRGLLDSDLMDIARIGESVKSFPNPTSALSVVLRDASANPGVAALNAGMSNVAGSAYMNPVVQWYAGNRAISPALDAILRKAGYVGGVASEPLIDDYLQGRK